MGRRILAFFLGMLFGIILVFGGVVAAIYIGATTVKPGDIYPDSDKFLGDLANMSLYEIYMEISNLYKEKLGITDEKGKYFTLGEFMERYHIDPVVAFGKPLPEDLEEIPILELLGGKTDTAFTQMRASVPFSFVNFMTQKKDSEGNLSGGYFSAAAIEKLRKHPMSELTEDGKGVTYVLSDLVLVDLLTTAFPAEEPTEGDKIMWALGQSSVGKLLGGMGGNLLLQFKDGGAFETVGTLAIKELMGSTSSYMKVIFGNKAFADLIDEQGNLLVDSVINAMYLGSMLGYERREVNTSTGYNELITKDDVTVLQGEDGSYAITVDGISYEAKQICGDNEHTHEADCIKFVWYNMTSCESDGHEHNDDCYTQEKQASGMMEKLSCERMKDLNSIPQVVKNMTLYDVLEDDIPSVLKSLQHTKIGELSAAIDAMYLGEFLGYEHIEVADGEYNWYQRHDDPICNNTDEGHEHDDNCYLTIVEGMMYKLSNQTVKDLGNLNNTIKTFTLKDVLGDDVPSMFKSIEDTAIKDIGTAIKGLSLRDILSHIKKTIEVDDTFSDIITGAVMQKDDVIAMLDDDGVWYEAKLNCSETHVHIQDCYEYVWYELTDSDASHEHTFDDNCYTAVKGLISRISHLTVSELSANNIMKEIDDTPLSEIIPTENANGLLKELGEVKIGNLSKELDALYVGIAMGYGRVQYEKGQDWQLVASDTNRTGENEIWSDGNYYYFYDKLRNKFYAAQLNCNIDHKDETGESVPHSFDCYGYVWLDCKAGFDSEGNKIDHTHSLECNHAKGLNAKIANLRIDELSDGNLTRISTSLTISDLIESEMMSLGDTDEKKEENSYKLAILSCKDNTHYFEANVSIGSMPSTTKTFYCTLQDYFTYKATVNDNISAKDYWLLTHTSEGDDSIDIAHRDYWMNQSLTTFISTLLGAL